MAGTVRVLTSAVSSSVHIVDVSAMVPAQSGQHQSMVGNPISMHAPIVCIDMHNNAQ